MAHFAELDENNVVLRVMVIDDNDCLDKRGKESEKVGAEFCKLLYGGNRWIQTSYNGRIRGRFASVGGTYNAEFDVFIGNKPFPTWVMGEDDEWYPPIPYPSDDSEVYYWSEGEQAWIVVPQPELSE